MSGGSQEAGRSVASKLCAVLAAFDAGNDELTIAAIVRRGISFGGVAAFIFADLIIAPILNIYRKYYGVRMAAFLLGTFFAAMAAAGYVIELVFGGLGLVPDRASAKIPDQGISWDYTTWLNIVFLILAAALIVRFARTGGAGMLRMMGGTPEPAGADGGHAHHGIHGTTAGSPAGPGIGGSNESPGHPGHMA
jgi:uncharacterized protein